MLNVFHGIAALLFALLLELFAGNWYVVVPFSSCVLNRITAKFSLPWVFLSGFFTGLVLDLIYWRIYPGAALATGLTVTAVRLICDRSKISTPLGKSLFMGTLTGIFSVLLMVLFTGYADSRRFPVPYHMVTSVAGALIFQLLISVRKQPPGTPERSLPADKKTPRNGGAKKKTAPRGAAAPRSAGKKSR